MSKSREPTMQQALRTLVESGVEVNSIIDIGVLALTKPLLDVFPEKVHYLFEPVQAHNPKIEHNYRNVRYELHNIAVSSADGEMYLAKTSLIGGGEITHSHLTERRLTKKENPRLVSCEPVRRATLDTIVRQMSIPSPFLIKIDVDGHEVEVLKGAMLSLREASIVIVEAPLNRNGVSKFFERAGCLLRSGFTLMDIVDLSYYEGILWQVDLVFVRADIVKAMPRLTPFERKDFKFVGDNWYALNDDKFRKFVK